MMGPGGAMEALLEAKERGLVRHLGVTGHGNKVPAMHMQSLEHFDFDAVLLPYNYCQMQNARYAADFSKLYALCRERNVAMQTIKSIAGRPIGEGARKYNTYFYEPLETEEAIEKSVHWAMGLEGTFVITAGDMQLVPKTLDAAEKFSRRPSDVEMNRLMKEQKIEPIFK